MAGNQGTNLQGGKHPGSGRAPGVSNRKTIMMEELMEVEGFKQKLEDGTFITPAVFWATILNDPLKDDSIKHEVAKAAAPYWYRKQPQVIENQITTDENVNGFSISLIPSKPHE